MPPESSALEALSQFGASPKQIASHLGISVAELRRRPDFREAWRKGRAQRDLLLKQAETKGALAGDTQLLRRLLPTENERESERRLALYLRTRSR